MVSQVVIDSSSKVALYDSLNSAVEAILRSERDWLANLSNISDLIFHTLPDVNWAGFYLFKNGELVLGPFQGKMACTRIQLGRGVCGTAAQQRCTQVVADVELFPGHIACDSASRSEIVVPIVVKGELFGVLDIDSSVRERFDDDDRRSLEVLAAQLVLSLASSTGGVGL